MKKNYVSLLILILATIITTLALSALYKQKFLTTSYSFDKLNKITAEEFNEYIIENPSTILYIGDKTDDTNNKIEEKFINKLETLNLLENTIYIEKGEITSELEKIFKEKYKYVYEESNLPVILLIIDGEAIQIQQISENSDVQTIINYEVFE